MPEEVLEWVSLNTQTMTDQQKSHLANPMTVEMWIEQYFRSDHAIDQSFNDLLDDMRHGIEALYNPDSSVQVALKSSYFDMKDYRPPTTRLQARNCSKSLDHDYVGAFTIY